MSSTAIEMEVIVDFLSTSIWKWAAFLLLSKELIQTEDVWEFIVSNLPNRMNTSFQRFFIFHKINFLVSWM